MGAIQASDYRKPDDGDEFFGGDCTQNASSAPVSRMGSDLARRNRSRRSRKQEDDDLELAIRLSLIEAEKSHDPQTAAASDQPGARQTTPPSALAPVTAAPFETDQATRTPPIALPGNMGSIADTEVDPFPISPAESSSSSTNSIANLLNPVPPASPTMPTRRTRSNSRTTEASEAPAPSTSDTTTIMVPSNPTISDHEPTTPVRRARSTRKAAQKPPKYTFDEPPANKYAAKDEDRESSDDFESFPSSGRAIRKAKTTKTANSPANQSRTTKAAATEKPGPASVKARRVVAAAAAESITPLRSRRHVILPPSGLHDNSDSDLTDLPDSDTLDEQTPRPSRTKSQPPNTSQVDNLFNHTSPSTDQNPPALAQIRSSASHQPAKLNGQPISGDENDEESAVDLDLGDDDTDDEEDGEGCEEENEATDSDNEDEFMEPSTKKTSSKSTAAPKGKVSVKRKPSVASITPTAVSVHKKLVTRPSTPSTTELLRNKSNGS
ncbi:hypothetical protein H4R33_006437, partial [Dimargaris cristalligena]